MSLITALAVWWGPETHQSDINADDSEDGLTKPA